MNISIDYISTHSSTHCNAYCQFVATIGDEKYELAASVGARDSYAGTIAASGAGVTKAMVSAWCEDPSDFATVPQEHREAVEEALLRSAWRLWQEAELVHD
jgi:hypothetical protein